MAKYMILTIILLAATLTGCAGTTYVGPGSGQALAACKAQAMQARSIMNGPVMEAMAQKKATELCMKGKGYVGVSSNDKAAIAKAKAKAHKEAETHSKAQAQMSTILSMAKKQMAQEPAREEREESSAKAEYQLVCLKVAAADAKHPNDAEKNAHNAAVLANMKVILENAYGITNLHCKGSKP